MPQGYEDSKGRGSLFLFSVSLSALVDTGPGLMISIYVRGLMWKHILKSGHSLGMAS